MTLTVSLDTGSANFVTLSGERVSMQYVYILDYIGRAEYASLSMFHDNRGPTVDAELLLLEQAGCITVVPLSGTNHNGGDTFTLTDLGREIVALPRPE